MRISDWSSDVFSSDLVGEGIVEEERPAERTRALARFVAGVGICRPAPVDHVGDADALLLAHHGQQPFWLRGGNRGDLCRRAAGRDQTVLRSEEHTSELQSLMRISYAVFCLKNQTHSFTQLHTKINSNT